jgi:hypothetical protein
VSDDLSIPNQAYQGNRTGRYGIGQGRLRPRMDPDTRRLVLFAGGLGAVLVVLIGASSLLGRRSTEVPVVTADTRPIRIKPDNPGGMKIDGAENDVFSGGSDTADSKLSAAPENPDTKALRSVEAPVAETPQAPVAAAPAVTKPAVVPGPVATTAPAPARPQLSAAKPPPTKPPAATAEAHPAASAHPATVQLAALSSEAAARTEWQTLTRRMPELLNGRQPIYTRIEREGRSFWRVRTAGFADVAQARAFCEHVRTKGSGCSIAEF